MVNETADVCAPIFDLNFQFSKEKVQKPSIKRSSSGVTIDRNEKLLNTQKDPFETLPKSAENLSWKFFEQVSTVDNQLRGEESSIACVNGCQLLTTPRNAASDDHVITLNGHVEQPHTTDIFGKSNGYMPGATNKLSSQQSPDLIYQQQRQLQLQPQSQSQKHATFQFTSPTATFKRKKQQLLQQQQQQQNYQINNNYNCNNRNQLNTEYEHHQSLTTPCKSEGDNRTVNQTSTQRVAIVTPQHNRNNANDDDSNDVATTATAKAAAMISNPGVIINTHTNTNTEATATGISTGTGPRAGTTHSFKTRTLPAVSVVRTPSYATETGDNDEIAKPIHKRSRAKQRVRSRNEQSMGATLQHSADSFVDGIETHFSLIGWRKKCLYTLLALLLVLVVINMILTLWILKVMEFSPDGMGLLKIVPGGIQLTGQAIVMDMLRASTIRSRHGQPIAIESSRNFSINTRDTNGMLENHLFLGHDKLECFSAGFRINDTAGRNLFSVNRNEVTIGAHALRIDGEGGAIFRESIQTPHVRAEPGRELRLESPTRQLEMTAARDINLQSRAGGIELSALEDVKLSTLDGSLRFESTKILMPNLRTAQPPIPGTAQTREHLHRVFQLCACSNGKLFLAAAHSICAGDDSTVCR